MKIILPILLLVSFKSSFAQNSSPSPKPLLIKKASSELPETDTKTVYKSNAGFVKIFKLTDSLYKVKVWENIIYLNKENIVELKEAARIIATAEKGDKVSLTTFRCEITKGKMLGANCYWIQLFKQKSLVDLSSLSAGEIEALLKTSDIKSVKDESGGTVVERTKLIYYEELIKSYGITEKELSRIQEID